MAHKEVEGTPLATILHEALFVVYRDTVVSLLRQVLSADDVASASPVEAREKQIEAHESVAPVRDVFSVVDLNAANHLLNVFAHRLLPASKGRAAQEVAVAEFRRDIRQVRVWRDPVAHTTETNRPEGKDAIRAIEAAQRVLRQLGLDADALNRFVWRIRSTDEAARRAIDAATRYALPPRARLFGRVDDLRSFVSRLEMTDSNLLTVTGAGGAGKTSLAIEAVRELARRKALHALFVTVESATSEQQVLDQIGGAIGLYGSSDLEGQVVEKLQTNPTVVLIDNFEQALSATTLVDRIARRCERSVFVVTSRERLAVRREVTLELSTLIVPQDDDSIGDIKVNPAVAMFLSRLDAGGGNRVLSDDDYRDIAEIVRRVDGLCLAIELLAAQCVDRNIREVKADIPRLMSISSSDVSAPERHRTLNACLMISWRRSSEREQALLKRIAILFGEFSQSAVDEMCFDLRLGTPSDLTSSAHRRSLLRKTAEGYSFLDPVRQFIAAQASRDEQRKGMAALLRYAKNLAAVVSATDQPELVPLIEAFRIGSNALAMLELVHTIVDQDDALAFLLSWCPLSWRFDQSFGRWDDELIAMLHAFTRRRRRDNIRLGGSRPG